MDIVIWAGGQSIEIGLNLGIQSLLLNRFVVGVNYSFLTFKPTILTFTDLNFYKSSDLTQNPDIYNQLKELPLIVGLNHQQELQSVIHPNTHLISFPKIIGLNNCPLTGIFAIALALKFKPNKLFLLGFDWTIRDKNSFVIDKNYTGKTNLNIHYYKDIKHRGIGDIHFYEKHNPDYYFNQFKNTETTIYNVSPNSNINTFPKIDYPTFFNLLDSTTYNQQELINLSLSTLQPFFSTTKKPS